MHPKNQKQKAFTLVELLTVIAIIAVLMGLLFPAVGAVKDSARKAQAKNDCVQIVNAVKAYYTEYGKYPDGNFSKVDSDLVKILMAKDDTKNPRKIVFLEPPVAKGELADKRYGVHMSSATPDGPFYHPWGNEEYRIAIDTTYQNKVTAANDDVPTGVAVWSVGKDGTQGTSSKPGDDIYSWK